jgi:hypothetical protein
MRFVVLELLNVWHERPKRITNPFGVLYRYLEFTVCECRHSPMSCKRATTETCLHTSGAEDFQSFCTPSPLTRTKIFCAASKPSSFAKTYSRAYIDMNVSTSHCPPPHLPSLHLASSHFHNCSRPLSHLPFQVTNIKFFPQSQLLSEPAGLEVATPETATKQSFNHPFQPWDPFGTSTVPKPGSKAASQPSSPVVESNSYASPGVSRLSSVSGSAIDVDSHRNYVVSPPASMIAPSTAPTYSPKSQLFTDPAGLEVLPPSSDLEVVPPHTALQKDEGWGPMRTSFHQKIEPDTVSPYSKPNLIK